MKHKRIVENINSKLENVLNEIALERLDELDFSLRFNIEYIYTFDDLLRKSNNRKINFYNNELDIITTEILETVYPIYYNEDQCGGSKFNVGEISIEYSSIKARKFKFVKKADMENIKNVIFMIETITKELGEIKSISRTLYIALI